MKLSTLQRMGGFSIILGAILFTAWAILWPTVLPIQEVRKNFSLMVMDKNWIWISTLAFPGLLLMVFGFTAVYSRCYQSFGISGFIGYVLIVIAYIIQAAKVTWEIFLYPVIISYSPAVPLLSENILRVHPMVSCFRFMSQITIFLGVVLFCTALIRAKEFPKIAGILILSGAVVYAVGPMVSIYMSILGVLVLSAGCFVLGAKLASSNNQA